MKTAILATAVLCLASGCAGGPSQADGFADLAMNDLAPVFRDVVVTVTAVPPISDISHLSFTAENDLRELTPLVWDDFALPITIPPDQTFVMGIPSGWSGPIVVNVAAYDVNVAVLTTGTGFGRLAPDPTVPGAVQVTLKGTAGDGGEDMSETQEDMTVADGTVLPDLAADNQDQLSSDLLVLDMGPCGVCTPGQTRKVACAACSIEVDTCGMNCQWMAGPCVNVGVCAPGGVQQGNCGVCSQQNCDNNCQWSACQLKQGNTCNDGEMQPCQNPGVCSSSWTCQNCHWPGHCCG